MTVNFESAELQYKQILEDFFVSVYDEKSLPSHGIEHHRRVWNYARELVILLDKHQFLTDHKIIHKLIIACYLHDIGMSVDSGIKHGTNRTFLPSSLLQMTLMPLGSLEYTGILKFILQEG